LTNLKLKNELPINVSLVPTGESMCPWELYLPLKELGYEDHLGLWKNQNLVSSLSENNFACTAGFDNFAIDSFGNVYGCSLMVSMAKLIAGNIRKKTLSEIWYKSDIFNSLRQINLNDITGS